LVLPIPGCGRSAPVPALAIRPRLRRHGPDLVPPDADVVGLELESDPVTQTECRDELARQLDPAGAVEHCILLGDHALVSLGRELGAA